MSEDNTVWRDTLASSITKAIKAAKKLGYTGEAFNAMTLIAWSSYVAGEQDTKKSSSENKS